MMKAECALAVKPASAFVRFTVAGAAQVEGLGAGAGLGPMRVALTLSCFPLNCGV
jgi:hypothetical protein